MPLIEVVLVGRVVGKHGQWRAARTLQSMMGERKACRAAMLLCPGPRGPAVQCQQFVPRCCAADARETARFLCAFVSV
ncbi:hypothetical protein AAFF_G00082720 [Aldrovandia affinis]|uniref:Uncharacterized protein n=1 Tax=Aldrovandia affinis TaxID=143900 RepID=A0AAD7WCG4_9TELE|nr:hypothetical protein AAFF_G00082720 [Aldrovandia affinis]